MAVILIYVVFVLIGDIGVIFIAEEVEGISQSASLMTFFGLFALVFWVGWVLAVYVTERFIERPAN